MFEANILGKEENSAGWSPGRVLQAGLLEREKTTCREVWVGRGLRDRGSGRLKRHGEGQGACCAATHGGEDQLP